MIRFVLLIFCLTNSAWSSSIPDLDGYLERTQTALSNQNDKALLAEANQWMSNLNQHPSVVRFIKQHQPIEWHVAETTHAGDYLSQQVRFITMTWEWEWLASFEWVRDGDSWKLAHFEDLTRRPLSEEPEQPSQFIEHYLTYLINTQILLNEVGSSDLILSSTLGGFLRSGAGFWKNPVGAAALQVWFEQNWPIELREVSGKNLEGQAEIKATLTSEQKEQNFLFILENTDQGWMIKSFKNIAVVEQQQQLNKQANTVDGIIAGIEIKQDTPKASVTSMLKLMIASSGSSGNLQVVDAMMKHASELWVEKKKNRASMGRLAGSVIAAEMDDIQTWNVEVVAEDSFEALINAQPQKPNLLYRGIQFRLIKTNDNWLIGGANLFR